jgi:hypothetical protein
MPTDQSITLTFDRDTGDWRMDQTWWTWDGGLPWSRPAGAVAPIIPRLTAEITLIPIS